MSKLSSVLFCIGSAIIGTADFAKAAPLFAVQNKFSGSLISIDTATGQGTVVGPLSNNASRFALGLGNRNGRLFTREAPFSGAVLELDPNTGGTIQSFGLDLNPTTGGGLSFRSDGVGFVSDSFGGVFNNPSGRLWRFDITNSSSTEITNAQVPGISSLAFDSSDVLYGLSNNDQGLYIINQTTGAVTLVGNTGMLLDTSGVSGLTFASDGTLFGVFDAVANGPSSLYSINKSTGAATLIGATGFSNLSGLTDGDAPVLAAVPEPSSLVLLGIGALGLIGVRFRRVAGCKVLRRPVDVPNDSQ